MPPPQRENILIIKLGAFGDLIQALGAMAAIRRHHPATEAKITLLTAKPFVALAQACGSIDDIMIDPRPRLTDIGGIAALARAFRRRNFTRVYDLQNNDRTAFYLWLFGLRRAVRPEWVGAAFGASHRNRSPRRIAGHAFDGHAQTLALAGIKDVHVDRLDWMTADLSALALPRPYVLLIPGSSPGHPEKRWPVQSYAALAGHLAAQGYHAVVIGGAQEETLGAVIAAACPGAVNFCGRTAMLDLAPLARGAAGAIGNDTGPVHLIAATGCPTVVLFSSHSSLARHTPKGEQVRALQKDNLESLPLEDVLAGLGGDFLRRV